MIDSSQMVYLDNNATTPLDPAVVEEMLPFLTKFFGNPSSGYAFGAQARKAVDRARGQVAALLGCEPSEIVFTSSGTESDNAAINSALLLDSKRPHIVTTSVEHSAVARHCEEVAKRGCDVTFLSVNQQGALDLEELESAILPQTAIVSAMWANNETGVLFPIEEIAAIVRNKGVLFHTDAVQAVGKAPIKLANSPINFLSLSAHKLHGPKGVGALYINRQTRFRPSLLGGGQENGRRSGTENVASIVGLGKAAELAAAAMKAEQTNVRQMRDRFETGLIENIPEVSINGDKETRLPNTTNIAFAGIEAESALMMLDQRGVCCSAASACRTGSHEPSRVLSAMQMSPARARGSLRFSFSRFNSDADVAKALEIIPAVIGKLRALAPPPGLLA